MASFHILLFCCVGLIGLVMGVLGSFVLLRQESLLGDAMAHAALPGIAFMVLCTWTKNPLLLLFGGNITSFAGIMLIQYILHTTSLKRDAALGIILSTFFGVGLLLLTIIQKFPYANQSILNKFIFGNAALLLPYDFYLISVVCGIVLLSVYCWWKEFLLVSFDQQYASNLGYSVKKISFIFNCVLIIAIGMGLQTVGVIFMSTMLVAPAAVARQWTHNIYIMVLLSGMLGIISSIIGAYISIRYEHVPTGPITVVVISILILLSLIGAPKRGLIARALKNRMVE